MDSKSMMSTESPMGISTNSKIIKKKNFSFADEKVKDPDRRR